MNWGLLTSTAFIQRRETLYYESLTWISMGISRQLLYIKCLSPVLLIHSWQIKHYETYIRTNKLQVANMFFWEGGPNSTPTDLHRKTGGRNNEKAPPAEGRQIFHGVEPLSSSSPIINAFFPRKIWSASWRITTWPTQPITQKKNHSYGEETTIGTEFDIACFVFKTSQVWL